jgi:hypothetical protein
MSLQDDVVEAVNIEVMRRILEPVDDDIPDPGFDFDACVKALVKRTERKVKPLSHAKRHAYFLNTARSSMEWCRRINAPAQITERVEQWLDRLERQYPS